MLTSLRTPFNVINTLSSRLVTEASCNPSYKQTGLIHSAGVHLDFCDHGAENPNVRL